MNFLFSALTVQQSSTFGAENERTAFEAIEDANNDEANLRGEILTICRVSFFIKILFYANVEAGIG